VLGMAEKECLIERIAQEFGPLGASVPTSLTIRSASQEPPPLRTRAVVKIQDGCNNACTYCIVHIARGQQRSRPLHAVLDEIHARQVEGYQEIVLTGVHIGAYGHGRGDTLAQLVSSILAESDIPRLRLTSIEPWDLTLDLLRLWDNPRLCRHLHLPLQSGCTSTLRRMNRRYTAEQYQGLLQAARAAIPDLAVTTDVIVGFPGEDSAEFAESAHFVAAMGFARAHVFPFSARQGTPAADMPDQVPPPIKEERSATMRGIANTTARGFRERFLGRSMDVLWESRKGSTWDGLTDNYLRVEVDSTRSLHNCICPTRLSELTNSGFRGELLIESEDVADGANLSRSLTRLVAKA